jgi:hypothetical protein
MRHTPGITVNWALTRYCPCFNKLVKVTPAAESNRTATTEKQNRELKSKDLIDPGVQAE